MEEVTVGLSALALLVGFPLLLLGMLALLGALERWTVEPEERAAPDHPLTEHEREADIEAAVANLLGELPERPGKDERESRADEQTRDGGR